MVALLPTQVQSLVISLPFQRNFILRLVSAQGVVTIGKGAGVTGADVVGEVVGVLEATGAEVPALKVGVQLLSVLAL